MGNQKSKSKSTTSTASGGGGAGGSAGAGTAGAGAGSAKAAKTNDGKAGSSSGEDSFDIDGKLHTFKDRKLTVDDFVIISVLGKGSFGKVMLVKRKDDDGGVYAMKTLKKKTLFQRNQVEHTRTERKILQSVKHPFLVSLVFAFQTPDKLYLVTDFAAGGELFHWLKKAKRFSKERARLYAAEIILALEFLHSKDIVYRDLKPENILLDGDGHVKVTDFGLSKQHVSGMGAKGGTKTFCGTPEYLAPEILEMKGHGKAVDWWSLGTLLYEMMAGLPPYYDTNMQTMYEKILYDPLEFPSKFDADTRDLLSGMLTRDVDKRLGSRGAKELKDHAFFKGLDWDKVYRREVKPEFMPPKREVGDVRNFDKEFTKMKAVDTPVQAAPVSASVARAAHFEGFTFAGDSAPVAM